MTVSSTTVKNSYSGNGSTTQFAYGYKIFADSDLQVIIRTDSTGAETVKTLTTHYTVAGAGDASGGSITFTSGNTPASGQTVVIIREVPQTQAIDYIANDPFPAESHEEGLDRATMTTQQVQEELNRSIKLSRTNTMTSTEFTVGATDRANKVLAFDSSGEISVTQELGTFKGSDATVTTAAYAQRDIIKSTTAAQLNNIYICVADSVVGDSLTDTDHFALLVDAVSAATSQSAAATSATAAASSATASASSATTSANSATTSGNSATAAANSATAAATSATEAAASADAFDDVYLGSKSSDPSTDNDGAALAAGMLYFNTTTDLLRVYSGSAWQNAAVDTTNFITVSGTQTLTNKTLTSPKVGTSILDTNGNELAKITATGSAVNEFTVANAATGNGPTLSSTGGDSNIDLDLLAKGTGHVTVKGNTNSGAIQLNCEVNTHGQQIKAQPHSAGVTNTMLLPAGADSTLVSLVSADTLTNKTLTSPKINENVAVTSTATELNILDGATTTAAEINYNDIATLGTTAASKTFTADANNYTKITGAVANEEATLTDASTIAWDVVASPVAKVTLSANRTLAAPSGSTPIAGQFVALTIIQDGTGSRTLSFNAVYEFTADTAPTLTTTAAKGDLFIFKYNGSKWLEVGRNLNLTLS